MFVPWPEESMCPGNSGKVVNLSFQGSYAFVGDTAITKLNCKLRLKYEHIKYFLV